MEGSACVIDEKTGFKLRKNTKTMKIETAVKEKFTSRRMIFLRLAKPKSSFILVTTSDLIAPQSLK